LKRFDKFVIICCDCDHEALKRVVSSDPRVDVVPLCFDCLLAYDEMKAAVTEAIRSRVGDEDYALFIAMDQDCHEDASKLQRHTNDSVTNYQLYLNYLKLVVVLSAEPHAHLFEVCGEYPTRHCLAFRKGTGAEKPTFVFGQRCIWSLCVERAGIKLQVRKDANLPGSLPVRDFPFCLNWNWPSRRVPFSEHGRPVGDCEQVPAQRRRLRGEPLVLLRQHGPSDGRLSRRADDCFIFGRGCVECGDVRSRICVAQVARLRAPRARLHLAARSDLRVVVRAARQVARRFAIHAFVAARDDVPRVLPRACVLLQRYAPTP
jgi:hypothetical protein